MKTLLIVYHTRGVKTAFAGWFRSEAPLRASLARGTA